jgi:hypothetical protein
MKLIIIIQKQIKGIIFLLEDYKGGDSLHTRRLTRKNSYFTLKISLSVLLQNINSALSKLNIKVTAYRVK